MTDAPPPLHPIATPTARRRGRPPAHEIASRAPQPVQVITMTVINIICPACAQPMQPLVQRTVPARDGRPEVKYLRCPHCTAYLRQWGGLIERH